MNTSGFSLLSPLSPSVASYRRPSDPVSFAEETKHAYLNSFSILILKTPAYHNLPSYNFPCGQFTSQDPSGQPVEGSWARDGVHKSDQLRGPRLTSQFDCKSKALSLNSFFISNKTDVFIFTCLNPQNPRSKGKGRGELTHTTRDSIKIIMFLESTSTVCYQGFALCWCTSLSTHAKKTIRGIDKICVYECPAQPYL